MTEERTDSKNGTLTFVAVASIAWIAVSGFLFAVARPCAPAAPDFWHAHITCMTANEMGDFLAGAFSPLAFLWLIAAVLLQKDELAAQRSELRQSREIAKQQFEESRKNVDYIRQQTEIMSQEHESEQLKEDIRSVLQPAFDAIRTFEDMARNVVITHVFDTLTPFTVSTDRSDLRRLLAYIEQLAAFWAEAVPLNSDNGPVEFSDTGPLLRMHEDLTRVRNGMEKFGDDSVIEPLTLEDIDRGLEALEALHAQNDSTSPFSRR